MVHFILSTFLSNVAAFCNVNTNFVTNYFAMTYIVIDTNDRLAEGFLEYVKTLPFAKIEKGDNVTTIKAMEQAKKGKTTKHKNVKELISFLNK